MEGAQYKLNSWATMVTTDRKQKASFKWKPVKEVKNQTENKGLLDNVMHASPGPDT